MIKLIPQVPVHFVHTEITVYIHVCLSINLEIKNVRLFRGSIQKNTQHFKHLGNLFYKNGIKYWKSDTTSYVMMHSATESSMGEDGNLYTILFEFISY